ncbi:MarR family transcriptional regulator [Natrinema versiforme JCM 10478]|uniref:MarR family transcriptional regulator n=2 Tax=Natrinema versiforme TaxID=88724 RepID=L9XP09_9EURY|nr:MarR family transcriptional regulator [Natrinema versiforme JCM 10478]
MVSSGENGAQATSVGEYFTYREVAVVVVAAFVCGASGTYLVVHDQTHVLASPDRTPTGARTQPRLETNGGTTLSERPQSPGEQPVPDEKRWEETLEKLSNNQETIYAALVEAGGELAQQDLVEETDLSKATVSRTLDKLEYRELVERQRNGMGNTIRLQ